ncbi:hypothetical protein OQ483_02495 [Enterobacter bugandensis]|uniref:hypothetical protein n=1 Tax=Enterobacter bugandensis TaxID=881260 RepID=UPI00283A9E9B|nr:hypothetical protein [Enterobacter bugandensis]WMU73327.1 hypothetical protein OQ483_02495 [Enterobacter bugandensis]
MDSFVTTQTQQSFKNLNIRKYIVQDPLLSGCIGMGRANSANYSKVQGFNCGKDFGYALLSYFASRALNISRIPFCEDRIYNSFHLRNKHEDEILLSLDEERVNEICNEIREIYKHTQQCLQQAGLDSVKLRRELRGKHTSKYIEHLIVRKAASETLGKDHLHIEMDSLNSFGDAGEYLGLISLQLKIPAKDILYCYSFIESKHTKSWLVEPGEWVVLNRSPTGVVKLPTSSILVRDDKEYNNLLKEMDSIFAENYLSKNSPLVLRSNYR